MLVLVGLVLVLSACVGDDGISVEAGLEVATSPSGNTIDGVLDLVSVTSLEVGDVPERVEVTVDEDGVVVSFDGVAEWRLTDGGLVAFDGTFVRVTPRRLEVEDALPDGVVVKVDEERSVVLAGPTDVYGHAVLGDGVEAREVAVVDAGGARLATLAAESGRVIEQRRVFATELDGEQAVVVTTSSDVDGARVEVWSLESDRRVIGPAIGTGNRWRHVVGVAPLPDGGIEIAEVITPHLDKVVSFLRVEGDRLVQVDAVPDAIASHALGSRVLDQAALVDVDGDGRRDLVGPAADGDGIAWVVAGSDTADHALAGLRVATNMALATRPDGSVVLAWVSEDGRLVVHG